MGYNKNIIYYFTGTGNSLQVARIIENNLGNCTIKPINYKSFTEKKIGDANTRIGIVYPVYYGTFPRIVKKFLEYVEFDKNSYIFGVVSYGGVGGGAVNVLDEFLKSKNVKLSYGNSFMMPRNYIMKYNPEQKPLKTIEKAKKKLEKICEEINSNTEKVYKGIKFSANNLYNNIEQLDQKFYSDNNCNGCGTCQKICPVQNIKLENSKPTWLHKCEHCAACISWCPKSAIQYGEKTLKRTVYRNPYVKISDMIID